MDWKNLGVFATLLAVFVTMWWQLDRKIEYEISALDNKLDRAISALDNKLDRAISALDNKLDRAISTLDRKVDQLNTLLTNNLIALNRDIGELQGASHTHSSPPTESAD